MLARAIRHAAARPCNVTRMPLARGYCSDEQSLSALAASSIVSEIKSKLSGKTFIGRGQYFPDAEMDRYGLVAIRDDGSVEHLRDGPLPAEDGMDALCEAVKGAGVEHPYMGELDFNASQPWGHGYYYDPSFGIFSQADGMLCSVEGNSFMIHGEHAMGASDVSSVGVRLSETKDSCWIEVNLGGGSCRRVCELELPGLTEDEMAEESKGEEAQVGHVLRMNEMAVLVWETDWAIKAAAQLTLALRNQGGGEVHLGIAEDLHAQHNSFAQMRNELLMAGSN
eukprot:TRINITY_DN7639_c0_g1_i4.p1 TRINITY_DN7639_c0_g1~~TRINITY_DN7639_c0_g1_i4.p1  ORF type:complete len:281 (+),score=71.10 TRINITY_DN7639_c0_g1_i4:92-934(+)